MAIIIDLDARTAKHEDGEGIDFRDIYSVLVVTEGGYGDKEVIVSQGLEGDGGEPVLRFPLPPPAVGHARWMGEGSDAVLATVGDHLDGYHLVEVQLASNFRQPGVWTPTDFGYVATALRVPGKLDPSAPYVATLNYDDEIVIRHSGEDVDLVVVGGRALPTVLAMPASEEWEPEEYDKILRDAGWRRVSEWTEPLTEPFPVAAVEPLA